MKDVSTEINLAVYMERLDSYIESQTTLNDTLCFNLEKVNGELADINMWRQKIYGGKTILVALGVLVFHTSAIMGSFVALINFMNK